MYIGLPLTYTIETNVLVKEENAFRAFFAAKGNLKLVKPKFNMFSSKKAPGKNRAVSNSNVIDVNKLEDVEDQPARVLPPRRMSRMVAAKKKTPAQKATALKATTQRLANLQAEDEDNVEETKTSRELSRVTILNVKRPAAKTPAAKTPTAKTPTAKKLAPAKSATTKTTNTTTIRKRKLEEISEADETEQLFNKKTANVKANVKKSAVKAKPKKSKLYVISSREEDNDADVVDAAKDEDVSNMEYAAKEDNDKDVSSREDNQEASEEPIKTPTGTSHHVNARLA